jgi:hypothetical protein
VWLISAYSIIGAISSYIGLVKLFSTDPVASHLPIHEHYFAYFLPGLNLTAGVALGYLKKIAFPLYAAYFALLLTQPVIMSSLYTDPYLRYSLPDIYRRALTGSSWLIFGWVVSALVAGYVWLLYKRHILS